MFEAYVTNLGLYPERGAGAGEYLKFPTTVEEVQALFSRIGIDGKQYEEYFITDYDSDILGLTDHLGEYESLDELNSKTLWTICLTALQSAIPSTSLCANMPNTSWPAVLYALKDFLIKRLGSLLEHTT